MSGFEIKVKNLSEKTDKETLHKMFEKYGKVLSCTERLHWGGAFVTMKSDIEGEKAVNTLNGMEIDGKKLFVQKKGSKPSSSKGKQTVISGSGGTDGYFINPYNFIPVTEVKQSDETIREYYSENSHFQDRFREDTVSGRVVCEIETESAMFIGAGKAQKYDNQTKTPAKLVPFSLNGEPAIPPSSIKGMLSSVMEAASNSALRVLERQTYTRRMEFKDALGKIGVIVKRSSSKKSEQERPFLLPLKRKLEDSDIKFSKTRSNPFPTFNPSSFDKSLSVYLDGYNTVRNPVSIVTSYKDFSVDGTYYYLNVSSGNIENKIKVLEKKDWKTKKVTGYNYFLLGYKIEAGNNPFVDEKTYSSFTDKEKGKYHKGIFKVLGIGPNRKDSIPENKKHEFFLFCPNNREFDMADETELLEIDEAEVEFNVLADERSALNKGDDSEDMWLPYMPIGRWWDREKNKKVARIRENDVVYYENNGQKVTKLSFSACWRDFCGNKWENNDAYGYFKQVDKNGFLLPPCLANQNGKEPKDLKLKLTPVCSLMGFVEEKPLKEGEETLALAGRLFSSPGILSPDQDPASVRLLEKTLKELASPKPPCPEFYFHRKPGAWSSPFITKKELSPNGRKFYWHHHNENDPYAPNDEYVKGTKGHYKRIVEVKPVKKGTKFLFAIDFFNLTYFELGMLLYALRPNDKFRHQIGMGKPIGMGRIKIDILNLLFVNRQERYRSDPLFSSVFFHTRTHTDKNRIKELQDDFTDDDCGLFNKQRFCPPVHAEHEKKVDDFVGEFKKRIIDIYGEDWFVPLETIGDPGSTDYPDTPVQYPNLTKGGLEESYKWWVRNSDKEKWVNGKKMPLAQVPDQPGKKADALPFNPGY